MDQTHNLMVPSRIHFYGTTTGTPFFSLIEVQLTYNVVLVLGIQYSDSVTCIYIFFVYILLHYGLLQDIE